MNDLIEGMVPTLVLLHLTIFAHVARYALEHVTKLGTANFQSSSCALMHALPSDKTRTMIIIQAAKSNQAAKILVLFRQELVNYPESFLEAWKARVEAACPVKSHNCHTTHVSKKGEYAADVADTEDDHVELGCICGESFMAADGGRVKTPGGHFLDTGVMAGVCRHDRVIVWGNMWTPSKQQFYALAIIDFVMAQLPVDWRVGILYDVGCQIHQSALKWNLWVCQLWNHPQKSDGWGLTDGEGSQDLVDVLQKQLLSVPVSDTVASRNEIVEITSALVEQEKVVVRLSKQDDDLMAVLKPGDPMSYDNLIKIKEHPWFEHQLNIHALKAHIIAKACQKNFEMDNLTGAFRSKAIDHNTMEHTSKALKWRYRSVKSLVVDYNKHHQSMIKLRGQRGIPRNVVIPPPIDIKGLFNLDVDNDIWKDVGLVDDKFEGKLWFEEESAALMAALGACKDVLDGLDAPDAQNTLSKPQLDRMTVLAEHAGIQQQTRQPLDVLHNPDAEESVDSSDDGEDFELTIALYHFSHYGNAASVHGVAQWAVMVSILALHDEAICWPTAGEKEDAKHWVESASYAGWRGGYCFVDGTLIPLAQKPGFHGDAYFD
ncbi:hypothetical protein BS47DRAFT_1362853 [Hydnum rufescens UP504]|uniref:Uncharacterized protein n=1 Tax=Hydnum rufescens UP504 TaxID=1448309 RepID=A0A9P6DS27_9AGAM|nr:hypothetical protein BS47DRAFT_1362853 [Hydnum rufescens UP504]